MVSLAPSLTDSVLELGAARRLVGVLDGGERPAAIGDYLPVGRYGQVNLERLRQDAARSILVWPGSVPEAQLQRLRDFGIALFIAEPHSLDELALQLAALGEALGEAEAGHRLSTRFREGMAAPGRALPAGQAAEGVLPGLGPAAVHHWRTPGDQRCAARLRRRKPVRRPAAAGA